MLHGRCREQQRSSAPIMVRPLLLLLLLVLLLGLCSPVAALRPSFSWKTLGDMSFFHACNESESRPERHPPSFPH